MYRDMQIIKLIRKDKGIHEKDNFYGFGTGDSIYYGGSGFSWN